MAEWSVERKAMRWMALGGILVFVLAAAGCNPPQRHALMTVFFEGVPPLESELSEGETPSTVSATAPEPTAESASPPDTKPQPTATFHPPFKLRLCEFCHPIQRPKGTDIPRFDPDAVTKTRMPVPALCYQCHPDKEPTPEELKGVWMHGPVAYGVCTFCHSPHVTETPFLLLAKPVKDLCTRCHEPDKMHIGDAPTVGEGDDCTDCHFGHLGKTRFLLKSQPSGEKERPAPEPSKPPPALLPPQLSGPLHDATDLSTALTGFESPWEGQGG